MNPLRFLILLAVFLGLNIYLFIRGWQAMPDRRLAHTLYAIVFIICDDLHFCGGFCRAVSAFMDDFYFRTGRRLLDDPVHLHDCRCGIG